MSLETYLLYLGVLAAFFATPPDTSQLLIISNTLRHGLRRSMATVFGDLTASQESRIVTKGIVKQAPPNVACRDWKTVIVSPSFSGENVVHLR